MSIIFNAALERPDRFARADTPGNPYHRISDSNQSGRAWGLFPMRPQVVAILPARLKSTRLAGKVLMQHRGKPLLYHVWSRVRRARQIDLVAVATDSKAIADAARAFGAEVVMTSRRHQTGTDRVAEAAARTGGEIIINVQADNFGLTGGVLDRVIARMKADRSIRFATLARPVADDDELFDPNLVKVVVGADGRALWFSRYPLPYLQRPRPGPRARQADYLAHLGVYFFRRRALAAYAGWKRTAAEKAESLEQLRILEHGGIIRVFRTSAKAISVDTARDWDELKTLGG